MRILIITYSREVNPGTFLQAYGVQYALNEIYPDAQIDLLKHKRLYSLSGANKDATRKIKKDLNWFKGRFLAIPRRLKYEYQNIRKFNFTKQEFGLFDYNEEEFKKIAESYDLIVVGSDTILIELKKKNKYGLMWLLGINTKKILFAASASPAKYDISEADCTLLKKNFSNYLYLGVRDTVTYNLLKEKLSLGNKVEMQYDPTYVIPDSHFTLPLWLRVKLTRIRKKKKIALVNFNGRFEEKEEITKHLHSRGYYTISTLYNPWADNNIMSLDPFGWAALFRYIDVAVTERFHDSVFALRNNKPVIAIDWSPERFASDGSSKTNCLLTSYSLDDMHFTYRSKDDRKKMYAFIDSKRDKEISQITSSINDSIAQTYQNLMIRISRELDF